MACLFILNSGALTGRLINHVHSISHVVFQLAAGPGLLFGVRTVEFARDLARHFRSVVDPRSPAAVVQPSRNSGMNPTVLRRHCACVAAVGGVSSGQAFSMVPSKTRLSLCARGLARRENIVPHGATIAAYRANGGDVYYLYTMR